MTPRSVLVVVPTTGGPLRLCALQPRPGLPASAAFAQGDYRPLPWSADYARLAAPGGPLARLPGMAGVPHALRLSGSFEAGRSWEVPVCLAHGLIARGLRLAAEPGEADLVLWATGAVDLDLAIQPGDYALLDKLARSRDLLAGAPQADLAVLLPQGPEREEAERTFGALGRARPPVFLPSGSVPAALDALTRPAATEPAAPGRSRFALPAAVAAGLAVAAALGTLQGRTPSGSRADEPLAPAAQTAEAEPPGPPAPVRETPAAAPVVLVEELIAPARSSCRRVAFGADPAERRPVPAEGEGRLRASRLVPDLCGLAFRPAAPGARIEVGPELRSAALPPAILPDGAQAYYLREGSRQNLVYSAQAVPEAGAPPSGGRLTHALIR